MKKILQRGLRLFFRRQTSDPFKRTFLMVALFVCTIAVTAKGQSSTFFSVNFKEATLSEVFKYLGDNSEYVFTYSSDELKVDSTRVTRNFKNASIDDVLKTCLEGTCFTYEKVGKHIIIKKEVAKVEEYVLKGKVVDQKGMPLPGVTIQLVGTSVGTATDVEGNFSFHLPLERGDLTVSFVGFKAQKVPFVAGKLLTVKMEEDVATLDEVTVRAYGTQKKRVSTSAISSVKGKDIQELPTHSLESLLQGRMAGVEVNNISGSPGGGGSIVAIRGYNSLFSGINDGEGQDREMGTPLYVVDGVPIEAFTSAVTGSNTLADIDPATIESIEVLKDAASAAIYGSRAGNGVILITTKKGRVGKGKFSANASYSLSWLPETPYQIGGNDERRYFMNALENARGAYYNQETGEWKMTESYEEVYKSNEYTGPFYNYFWGGRFGGNISRPLQDSLNPFYNNSTDWWRYLYRTAEVVNANIQASGGSENFQYMIGAGYFNEQGIVVSTGFKRFNLLANLSARPSDKLKVDFRSALTYSDRSRGDKSGNKIESVGADPTKDASLLPGDSYIKENMLKMLNGIIEKNNSYSYRTSLLLTYNILNNLEISVSGSLNFNQQNQNKFEPAGFTSRVYPYSKSSGAVQRNLTIQNEDLLHYTTKWKEDHAFDVLLGFSVMKNQEFLNSGSGENGPSDYVHYVGKYGWGDSRGLVSTGPTTVRSAFKYMSDLSEEVMCSYFGRLSYNYKERYLFETTIRRDGSSVFGEKVRWATFPSIAAGWAFSEEPFMKQFFWLSFGKIRASWGRSGQIFSQPYLAYGLFSASPTTFQGHSGMMPDPSGGLINRKLSWEETDQYDIGLDLDLFNYRLKVVLDYYYRYTDGLLSKVDLPGNISWFYNQWRNAIGVSNEGVELELDVDILRETAVKLRTRVTAARNWNLFRKSANGEDLNEYVIGKSMYQIRAFKTEGVYNNLEDVPYTYLPDGTKQLVYAGWKKAVFMPGTRRIIDLNGDGSIDENDQYFAASPLPKASGGIFFELRWKDFDLNLAFNYSLGRHIVNTYQNASLEPLGGKSRPLYMDTDKLNSWKGKESVNAVYPLLGYYRENTMQYASYMNVFDTDIEKVHSLRLKQLTLGYNLNQKVARRVGLSGARLFVTMENLFMLTNYSGLDPEIVNIFEGRDMLSSYPLPRKFTVGLTLNF